MKIRRGKIVDLKKVRDERDRFDNAANAFITAGLDTLGDKYTWPELRMLILYVAYQLVNFVRHQRKQRNPVKAREDGIEADIEAEKAETWPEL